MSTLIFQRRFLVNFDSTPYLPDGCISDALSQPGMHVENHTLHPLPDRIWETLSFKLLTI